MIELLSFDVGVKNLAYCIVRFENNIHEIRDWGIIDIMDNFSDRIIKCSVSRNGKKCVSDASVYVDVEDTKIGF